MAGGGGTWAQSQYDLPLEFKDFVRLCGLRQTHDHALLVEPHFYLGGPRLLRRADYAGDVSLNYPSGATWHLCDLSRKHVERGVERPGSSTVSVTANRGAELFDGAAELQRQR